MRPIDADALKQMICQDQCDHMKETCDADCELIAYITNAPTVDAVPVVRCKDCRWWDKKPDSPYGYCHACKHGHLSEHWEIDIYRVYKGDWYCADGERYEFDGAEDEEDEEETEV